MKPLRCLGLLGIMGILVLGCLQRDQKLRDTGLAVGQVAPVLEGRDGEDVALRLSDLKGKVVLLDFWQTC